MISLDDSNQNRTWWYNQLKLSEDWNSMTVAMRGDLLKKLQRALLDLTKLNMSKDEMLELIHTFDQATVWDAILALQDLSGRNTKSHWELMAYLKKTASGMWKAQHPSKPLVWQLPEPVSTKKKKSSQAASWDVVERNDPLNFNKRYCSDCGERFRGNSTKSTCSKCKSKGNGNN